MRATEISGGLNIFFKIWWAGDGISGRETWGDDRIGLEVSLFE